MKNEYLGIEIDDMQITDIINNLNNRLKPSMSNEEFKEVITELDNIQSGLLSEYDEDIIADIYNNLYTRVPNQIEYYKKDTTMINGQTFSQLMRFFSTVGW